jgi:putative FmdB family regulatory protein
MPIYEYRCKPCGKEFEMIRFSQDDDKEITCPACGKKKVEKVMSLPAGSHGSCQSCSASGPSCSST